VDTAPTEAAWGQRPGSTQSKVLRQQDMKGTATRLGVAASSTHHRSATALGKERRRAVGAACDVVHEREPAGRMGGLMAESNVPQGSDPAGP
jgi:hypothetical protein